MAITIGNRDLVWANVFESDGLWHFNIHRTGEQFAVFGSNLQNGQNQQSAINQANDLIKLYSKG